MEKPLFRWVVGPVHPLGFDILEHSIKMFKKINKEFDLLICHNNLESQQLDRIKTLNVPLFCQDNIKTNLIWKPSGVGNKLYPPRLRLNSHEIIVDNDVVILNNNFLLDFLNNDYCFVTDTPQRNLGNFDKFVAQNINVNSGLIGLAPGFDFESKIIFFQKAVNQTKFEDYYDEQGMVAAIITSQKNYKILKTSVIALTANKRTRNPCAFHFVKANKGCLDDWDYYKTNKKSFI